MTTGDEPPAGGTGGTEPHLRLRRLSKRFTGFTAVDNLDLEARRGELVAILGPSGCGKSTTLRMIAGLSPATSGSILIGERDVTNVPPHRRDIGLVFQSYALFPHLTVLRNVTFGLEMRGVEAAEAARRAREMIALVKLTGKEDQRPPQLSGGQQQRVALARALVIRPSILLFDEPLSNLDAQLRDEMRAEIRDIQQTLRITSIFVTHDQVEALSMSDRVAVMSGGRLEQCATPQDLYERPATPFVATFVGRSNRLAGFAEGHEARFANRTIRLPRAMRGAVDIFVRPHRIAMRGVAEPGPAGDAVGEPRNGLMGTIRRSSYSGDVLQYDVAAEGSDAALTVERGTRTGEPLLPPGTPVVLDWSVADTLAFEARTGEARG